MNKGNNLVILKRLTKSFTILMLFFFFPSFYFHASAACYPDPLQFDFCACCEGTPGCDTWGENCRDIPSLDYCAGYPISSEGGARGIYITPYGYYPACESSCSPGRGKVAHEYCCTTPCGGTTPTEPTDCTCGNQQCDTSIPGCQCFYTGCKVGSETGDSCVKYTCGGGGDDDDTCTPVNGGWCGYGACQADGYQYRSCNCPAPSCGGASCSGSNKRECGKLQGIIWDDENENSSINSSEDWADFADSTCSTKVYLDKNFNVLFGGVNIINKDKWKCDNWKTEPTNFNFSYYVTDKAIPVVGDYSVRIEKDKIPEGYWPDTWEFYKGDDILSSTLRFSGAGLTATVNVGSPPKFNILNWNLREAAGLKGIIWHDKNGDNKIDTNEDWTNDAVTSLCSGMESPFEIRSSSFLGANIIDSWICGNWPPSTTNKHSFWVSKPNQYVQKQLYDLAGTPTCYACDSWEYLRSNSDGSISSISSGTGCSSYVDLAKGNGNILNFKMKQVGRIKGLIWSDDVTINGSRDNNEDWSGSKATEGLCSSRINPFSLLNEGRNTMSSWVCGDVPDNKEAWYKTSWSVTVGSEVPITLSNLPLGYECKDWIFRKLNADGVTTYKSEEGVGCTASVNITNIPNDNVLIWEMQPSQVYTLEVSVKQLNDDDIDCLNLNDRGPAPDDTEVRICASDKDISLDPTPCTKYDQTLNVSGGAGVVRFVIPVSYKYVTVTNANYQDYRIFCPSPTGGTVYYSTASNGGTENMTIGIKKDLNLDSPWVSSIDADIYAGSISISPPGADLTDDYGFSNFLINSLDGGPGGYAFSAGEISSTDKVSEKGGNAFNLYSGDEPKYSHESKWLENFSFKPPSTNIDVISGIPLGLTPTFEKGKIYTATCSQFNDSVLSSGGSYSVGDGGIALLFIKNIDECTLNIGGNVLSDGGRLIVITESPVSIESEVGGQYSTGQSPHVMLSFISAGDITFTSAGLGGDIPVMTSAPLVTKGDIFFRRNLGLDNSNVPAESVLAYPRYVYDLASLEREKSNEFLYYTGLTTYDLEWEYIY